MSVFASVPTPLTSVPAWVWLVAAVVAGFLIGAVSPATIIARVRKADLTQGSGNPGATNTGRLLGLRWGVVVGVVDVLKGLVWKISIVTFAEPVDALPFLWLW